MIGNVVRIGMKDLVLLWNDKLGLFFVLAFPLIMALFFGSVFGGGGGGGGSALGIAVVDLDESEASARFVEILEGSEALRVWTPTDEGGEPIEVTEALARERVREGRLTAYVVIPEGYAEAGPFGGLGAELRVGIDPSRTAEAGYLQGLLIEATFKRLQSVFGDQEAMKAEVDEVAGRVDEWDLSAGQRLVFKGFFASLKAFLSDMDPEVYERGPGGGEGEEDGEQGGGFSPVSIEIEEVVREGVGPRSAFEISFPQAMIWGVLGTCASFAVTLVRERKEGTLLRLRVAPHPTGVILAGKALACFATCAGALVLLTAIGHVIFDMRIVSYALYALGVVCTSLCFVGIMMAITTIGKTEEAVGGAGWGVLLIMAMLGGGMIPLMVMPEWMGALSRVSPVRWSIYALEGAVWRGLGFGRLAGAYAVLLGVGAAAFVFGVWVFRRREG